MTIMDGSLGKFYNARKDDKEWIDKEFERFNHVFDIGSTSKPSYHAKRTAEDLNLVCNQI